MALVMHCSLAVHPGDWVRTEIIEAHRIAVADFHAPVLTWAYDTSKPCKKLRQGAGVKTDRL